MAPSIVNRLERELGSSRVVGAGDPGLATYARDESGLPAYPPECAALCENADEVQAVLALAHETKTPVTPRGAGSGKVGGCLPVAGGIVLSTERMQRIREIDEDDMIAVVEPGVITGQLQSAVENVDLFYPPDPASLAYCSIGGNVACNAGGPRACKYGVTREYILGLEVALTNGQKLRVGRRAAKGVTGYDLVAGFVGSEGTFAVVTEIVCKLLRKPAASAALLATFASLAEAGAAVAAIVKHGFVPRALELMDERAIDHVRPLSGALFPRGCRAAALIELDGIPEGLEAAQLRCGSLCEQQGATDVIVADEPRKQTAMWEARRAISQAITRAHRFKISEDICVPRGRTVEMISRLEELRAKSGFDIACYGHAGDGNLHINIPCDDDPDDPAIKKRIDSLVADVFHATIAMGGTLSGEHGIGLTKRDYMPLEQSEAVLEWQRKWKRMWDPDHLLNPGKVLPPSPRTCHE